MIMTAEDLAFMKGDLCDKQGMGEDQLLALADRNGYAAPGGTRDAFTLGCLNDLKTEAEK